jgi:hypothetical protein
MRGRGEARSEPDSSGRREGLETHRVRESQFGFLAGMCDWLSEIQDVRLPRMR